MDIKTESVAYRLKKALSFRNMKQQELSEKTKISKASISQYLSGYAEPKVDRTYIMAKALHVNPVWLMGFDVPMEVSEETGQINRLTAYTGALASAVIQSPEFMRLAEDFIQLNKAQQESIIALVHSMIPDTHKGQ